ncbi:MAG: 1-acyl-sn-glycerol-3-phosphate acyltransferase [Anaerolineae bacterium]|nr:1-acyl-sn-glycerol-3-phosphate acyltransferase [Anaerolineae bacterium]
MSDNIASPLNEAADWRDELTWYTHETGVARLLKTVFTPLFRVPATIESQGVEHIPLEGPLVMAFNHISNYDVPFIVMHLPRHPFFMAKRELFRNKPFGWTIRQFGGFPINRGERDPWAIAQAGRVLQAGQMLFMFPEGTRSGPKAQLKRGKIGAVKLALEHQAPILPAAIFGTQKIRWGWKRNEVRLQFGEPLDVVALAGPPPYSYETLQSLTDTLMLRIAAMLPPAHRGVYAEKHASGPEAEAKG